MFCHKCGTEIPSEDASFCINCREPLLKITPSGSRPSNDSGSDSRDPSPSSVNLAFGDDDEALKMSDPIDFLMQESEENEEKDQARDMYKEEFQDGFQDEIQDDTPDINQDQIQNEDPDVNQNQMQDEVPDPNLNQIQDEVPDINQDQSQAEIPDEGQNQSQAEIPDENQSQMQDEVPDENQNQTQADVPDENQSQMQDEVAGGYRNEFQDNIPEGVRDGYQGENQDAVPSEIQDKIQEGVQEGIQEGNQDENRDASREEFQDPPESQTPADQPAQTEPTDKIKSPEEDKPSPLFTGSNTGSSMNTGNISSGQSSQAVETLVKKEVEKPMPPVLEVSGTEDPNKGENIIATAKIKVDKQQSNVNPEPKLESSASKFTDFKSPSDPTNLDIAKIRRSTGIAYLTGNSLTLAGGAKITPGDKIQIGESSYDVKAKPKNKNELYALIGSVVLSIFVTLYFFGAFSSSQYGTLVGLVVGSDSRPLSGQEVRIKETGDKFTTNSAGRFIFDKLSEGIYTVEYLVNDRVVGEERITVLSNKTSTVRLSRNSSRSISEVQKKPTAREKSASAVTVASKAAGPDVSKKKSGNFKTKPSADRGHRLS